MTLRAFEIIGTNKNKRVLRASDGTVITCFYFKNGMCSLNVERPFKTIGGIYLKNEADEILNNWLSPKLRKKKVQEAFDIISSSKKKNNILKIFCEWIKGVENEK